MPSIFNSPEILFINKRQNFVHYLRRFTSIYLMDWQEINLSNYNLTNYIVEIISAVKYLFHKYNCRIDLIGHCIGGTISLIAASVNNEILNSITLLNSPWDFSYLQFQRAAHKQLNLDETINNLTQVPKIYQQILFFLLNPQYFQDKIVKFFEICNQGKKETELFFRIENWLLSGHSLTKSTYIQLTKQLIDENIFHNKLNKNDKHLDSLELPVCIVIAEKDNIAPPSSTLPLLKIIKNSTLLEVEKGHINYLISTKLTNFFQKFEPWFSSCK